MKATTKKTKLQIAPVAPRAAGPHADVGENETALSHSDWMKLDEFNYFLQAVVSVMQTAGVQKYPEGRIDCMEVASLLRPMVEEFHRFIHSDLENREWWSTQDRKDMLDEGFGAV